MKNIIKLKLGVSLLTITFSMLGGIDHAVAQTCTTPPSCNTLGYKQSASDCTGQQMLKCPFDNSKVFCGGVACPEDYTLTGCETKKGTFTSCGEKCKYTSCKAGYSFSNDDCITITCYGYPITSCDSTKGACSTSDYCMKGTTKYYKYTSCNTAQGWKLDNGNCVPNWSNCGVKPGASFCPWDYPEYLANGATATCIAGGRTYTYNRYCYDENDEVKYGVCLDKYSMGGCWE